MICERCGKETIASIMSMFNTQTICLDCKKEETKREDYEQARKAESEAVLKGDFNYPGIGLKGKSE